MKHGKYRPFHKLSDCPESLSVSICKLISCLQTKLAGKTYKSYKVRAESLKLRKKILSLKQTRQFMWSVEHKCAAGDGFST